MASPHLEIDLTLPRRSFRLQLQLQVGAETLAAVGPSGAGKSTLLRAIAGLERPDAGRIALGDEVWFDSSRGVSLPPDRRSVGLVFQDYALFPHLSVRQNVAFGGRARVGELLERLRIDHIAASLPRELSGGERQRVALARALSRAPRVLLLDEPMAALDAHTRATVRAELRSLLTELGLPTLLVSHDFDDASALAERVVVIESGRIAQIGTPGELIARPASAFVASLTGANLVEGEGVLNGSDLCAIHLADGTVLRSVDRLAGRVGVVVQPSDVSVALVAQAGSTTNQLRSQIASIVRLGSRARVQVGPLTAEITTESVDRLALVEGQWAVASFKAVATRLVPLEASLPTQQEPATNEQ